MDNSHKLLRIKMLSDALTHIADRHMPVQMKNGEACLLCTMDKGGWEIPWPCGRYTHIQSVIDQCGLTYKEEETIKGIL